MPAFSSVRTNALAAVQSPGGETGRHAILRGWCRKASRFESAPGHDQERRHCSSGVEHSIRNRAVVGSNPTSGSRDALSLKPPALRRFFCRRVRGCVAGVRGESRSTARATSGRYSVRRRSRARSWSRRHLAGVIQLVECQLPKLDVAGSSPVARSLKYLVMNSLEAASALMRGGRFAFFRWFWWPPMREPLGPGRNQLRNCGSLSDCIAGSCDDMTRSYVAANRSLNASLRGWPYHSRDECRASRRRKSFYCLGLKIDPYSRACRPR
jgi:hypothetical protein